MHAIFRNYSSLFGRTLRKGRKDFLTVNEISLNPFFCRIKDSFTLIPVRLHFPNGLEVLLADVASSRPLPRPLKLPHSCAWRTCLPVVG